ncbi:4455_t:CDS:2 [Ambispora gerdemannii]|uniref:Flavin-containing monooxygenase 1 n=1 Tax=Ambispora gerdemannii TaxID=144530 RepID=A0A9N8VNM2_9GLOM|nr:4455_t:CDS:2 [Ambispora gerdemannii]
MDSAKPFVSFDVNTYGSVENERKQRIAIIGAGVSGLAALKQCLADNLDPVCFEQDPAIGGLWRYVEVDEKNPDPHSSMYRSAIMNTSKEATCFSDFPIPTNWPTYLPHKLLQQYLESYAENFDLYSYIKLNTKVIKVSQLSDNRWKVKYQSNETITTTDTDINEEEFDYVIVCSGKERASWIPNYQGRDTFGGKQIHSHIYRDPKQFEDKRIVVVGTGNSGIEIASELSHFASQVYLCARDGRIPWVVPRRLLHGLPLDHSMTRISSYIPTKIKNIMFEGLLNKLSGSPPPEIKPKIPLHKSIISVCSEFRERLDTGTIIPKKNIRELKPNREIELIDGTTLEDIDAVIYATGYSMEFSFLENWTEIFNGGKDFVDDQGPDSKNWHAAWLYKMVFPPRYQNIAFIGFVFSTGAVLPVSEMQARYVTGLIIGEVKPLPSPEEMDKALSSQTDCPRLESPKHPLILTPITPYLDFLAKDIGCLPSPTKVFWHFGYKAWKNVLFGVPSAIQYRLFGRQTWAGALEWLDVHNGGTFAPI